MCSEDINRLKTARPITTARGRNLFWKIFITVKACSLLDLNFAVHRQLRKGSTRREIPQMRANASFLLVYLQGVFGRACPYKNACHDDAAGIYDIARASRWI